MNDSTITAAMNSGRRAEVVRYAIDGRHRSKSFRTRVEAERYRGSLLQAVHAGDCFAVASGEPESWQPALRDVGVHEWARRWLGEQWSEWQPRTRTSATEALARFITVAVEPAAKPPDGLRVYLYTSLAPGSDSARDARLEKWMGRHCLSLGDLDRDRIAVIDRKLAWKLDGSPMAANTTNRIRIVARACVQAAIADGTGTCPPASVSLAGRVRLPKRDAVRRRWRGVLELAFLGCAGSLALGASEGPTSAGLCIARSG